MGEGSGGQSRELKGRKKSCQELNEETQRRKLNFWRADFYSVKSWNDLIFATVAQEYR